MEARTAMQQDIFSPWRFLRISGFSLCSNISLLYSTFIVSLPPWRWARIDPYRSQTIQNITFIAVGWNFNSFYTKKCGSLHSMLRRLFYGSYVLSQDSRSMIPGPKCDDKVKSVCANCKIVINLALKPHHWVHCLRRQIIIKQNSMKACGEWR
jgi:hypothetical protein